MLDAVREEVEETHRFFVRWFTGTAKPEELVAFGARLHPDVLFIGPSGACLDRAGLLGMFEGRHGANVSFAIEIEDVKIVHDLGDHIIATYVEKQFGARSTTPSNNARFTSVLFSRDLNWRHIHETGLPPAPLEVLAAALRSWGALFNWLDRGGGDRALAKIRQTHAAVVTAYDALPDAVHKEHPLLATLWPGLRDDAHGDAGGRFREAVSKALKKR